MVNKALDEDKIVIIKMNKETKTITILIVCFWIMLYLMMLISKWIFEKMLDIHNDFILIAIYVGEGLLAGAYLMRGIFNLAKTQANSEEFVS